GGSAVRLRARNVGVARGGGSCFFFSSRRRHTRFDCDWSSDVCSSDLPRREQLSLAWAGTMAMPRELHGAVEDRLGGVRVCEMYRSEERRVGKECRSWWSPCRQKKKMTT